MRHLISLKEQTSEDLKTIIELAKKLKNKRNSGELTNLLPNQTLIMLFQKSSTRTRLSFEAGMTELGGHAIFLDQKTSQFSLTDYRDEIRAVMRFGQVLMMRALEVKDVETAANFNQVPVIDACSEKYHPCQALGDFLTMMEYSNGLQNIKKIAWLGIENNVSNTLKLACAKLGVKIAIIAPKRHEISVDNDLNKMADATGLVEYTTDLQTGLAGADYVHTDTWMDMEFFQNGQIRPEMTDEFEARKKIFAPFQLNAKIIDSYCPTAKIMHCMPCHVGYEISADAISHKNSIIFDQAENRMHIQKAIILWLLGLEHKV